MENYSPSKKTLNLSNFNEMTCVEIDLENLSYYSDEPIDPYTTVGSFIIGITMFYETSFKKKKKKYKAKKNKRVEKIENLKSKNRNKNKNVKIILHSGINKETSLSKAAKEYYG